MVRNKDFKINETAAGHQTAAPATPILPASSKYEPGRRP